MKLYPGAFRAEHYHAASNGINVDLYYKRNAEISYLRATFQGPQFRLTSNVTLNRNSVVSANGIQLPEDFPSPTIMFSKLKVALEETYQAYLDAIQTGHGPNVPPSSCLRDYQPKGKDLEIFGDAISAMSWTMPIAHYEKPPSLPGVLPRIRQLVASSTLA